MAKPVMCSFCERPADRYCDYVIARAVSGEYQTCDLATCGRHAKQIGHVCVRGRGGCCDTIDHCLIHSEASTSRANYATAGVIAEIRADIQAKAFEHKFGRGE